MSIQKMGTIPHFWKICRISTDSVRNANYFSNTPALEGRLSDSIRKASDVQLRRFVSEQTKTEIKW